MAEDQVQAAVGHGGAKLLVPKIGAERCGNCKFQRQPGGPFGDTFLCLRYPPVVAPIPDIERMIPPNAALALPQGNTPFPAGGMQLVNVRNEVRFPPAPDDWWCGEWKPRFLDSQGERLS